MLPKSSSSSSILFHSFFYISSSFIFMVILCRTSPLEFLVVHVIKNVLYSDLINYVHYIEFLDLSHINTPHTSWLVSIVSKILSKANDTIIIILRFSPMTVLTEFGQQNHQYLTGISDVQRHHIYLTLNFFHIFYIS